MNDYKENNIPKFDKSLMAIAAPGAAISSPIGSAIFLLEDLSFRNLYNIIRGTKLVP